MRVNEPEMIQEGPCPILPDLDCIPELSMGGSRLAKTVDGYGEIPGLRAEELTWLT